MVKNGIPSVKPLKIGHLKRTFHIPTINFRVRTVRTLEGVKKMINNQNSTGEVNLISGVSRVSLLDFGKSSRVNLFCVILF